MLSLCHKDLQLNFQVSSVFIFKLFAAGTLKLKRMVSKLKRKENVRLKRSNRHPKHDPSDETLAHGHINYPIDVKGIHYH